MRDFTALLSHYKSPPMLCIMIMQTQGNEAYQVTQAQLKEQSVLKIHVYTLQLHMCTQILCCFARWKRKIFSPNENTENEMTTAADAKANHLIKMISSTILKDI